MQNPGQNVPAAKPARPPAPVPPPEFQADAIMKLSPAELVKLLKDPASTNFQKAKACQKLASVGTKEAVPAMAALLADAQLAHYARYGLETSLDASAGDALRGALPKLKGQLLIGVINSIGYRRDAQAAPALARLLQSPDIEVARAAAAALGKISGLPASKTLQDALGQTKGAVRAAVADAGLVCAEGLLAQGQREAGLALYQVLTRTDVPKAARLAAMHGIIAAEISLGRPR